MTAPKRRRLVCAVFLDDAGIAHVDRAEDWSPDDVMELLGEMVETYAASEQIVGTAA